jgi:ribosomal protein S18 acetylase RimI-like enzyme
MKRKAPRGASPLAGDAEGTKRRVPPRSPRDTALAVVAEANAARDLLARVSEPTRAFLIPGEPGGDEVEARCILRAHVAGEAPEPLRRWFFDLTRRNMFELYERTWGWSNPEKRRELAHSDARFIVAYEREGDGDAAKETTTSGFQPEDGSVPEGYVPVGFVHFRFEVEEDDSAVTYVYELQVEPRRQRGRGLGTRLMAAAEAVGVSFGLERCLLTVLKVNEGAARFYERGGYVPDADTPQDEECHYVILTKGLGRASGGEAAGDKRASRG